MSAAVITELNRDGLVRSASYMDDDVPVKFSMASTGDASQGVKITSGEDVILAIDVDFSKLNKDGHFGTATVGIKSKQTDWALTLDGGSLPVSKESPIPEKGELSIQIHTGDSKVHGAFDLATWKAIGLEKAPNLDSLVGRDVVAATKNFIPTAQAIMGYVAHHSEVSLNYHHRPAICRSIGPGCIVICIITFAAAMAICGALFAGGVTIPAAIVCAIAAALALTMCIAACKEGI